MKLYSTNENYKLYQGSMLDMLEVVEPNTIDSIVTDPPYELNFMNKGWDNAGISFNKETWEKCYEVLKEGGYLLAFGGTRTYHRIACAIEDAGFEIRDTIMWLYGSGFPKSQNIGKMYDKKIGETRIGKTSLGDGSGWDTSQNMKDLKATGKVDITKGTSKWEGWGTCLKPAFEPIIVARKPFKGTLVDNVIKNGVGGLNIDECRVGNEIISIHNAPKGTFAGGEYGRGSDTSIYRDSVGRFPANVILTYDETDFEEVCGGFPNTKGGTRHNTTKRVEEGTSYYKEKDFVFNRNEFNDSGSASRYFYCAKASKKDRNEGLDLLEDKYPASAEFRPNHMEKALQGENGNPYGRWQPRKNIHPTVKPTELMQYLVRLVSPKGATILDPFNGSGSTGKAVMYENKERDKNYKYIGIELTEEYLPIAKARIEYVCPKCDVSNSEFTINDYVEDVI